MSAIFTINSYIFHTRNSCFCCGYPMRHEPSSPWFHVSPQTCVNRKQSPWLQPCFVSFYDRYSGIGLCMHPANESRRYNVTSSLIGWAHTQNDPWGTWNCPNKAKRSFQIDLEGIHYITYIQPVTPHDFTLSSQHIHAVYWESWLNSSTITSNF